jgi:hypothetical protein
MTKRPHNPFSICDRVCWEKRKSGLLVFWTGSVSVLRRRDGLVSEKFCSLEYGTMDRVQKPSNPKCYTSSSQPLWIYEKKVLLDFITNEMMCHGLGTYNKPTLWSGARPEKLIIVQLFKKILAIRSFITVHEHVTGPYSRSHASSPQLSTHPKTQFKTFLPSAPRSPK